MSELQIGLLVLGALVVVGVLIFNKWQERRDRKTARGFQSSHDDVLLGASPPVRRDQPGDPTEPAGADGAVEASRPAARVEPHWEQQGAAGDALPRDMAGGADGLPRVAPALDERIDFIAEFEVEDALPGSQVTDALEGIERHKHVGCDGFNPATNAWERLDAKSAYEKVRVGVQLTDRGGPLKPVELASFQQAMDRIGHELGAAVDWPGAHNPLTNAAALDAFCAEVDVQIGINLKASAPFAETKLRGLAEANGFVRAEGGGFRRCDDGGVELLLLRQSGPGVVSLVLDVPRVPKTAAAFGLMTHCARTLAKGLDAKIVDDNQRPLDEAMLTRIGQGITDIQGRMEAAGMAAGGALALRLFA